MAIGLALSGGGFRATLFHLGVIETLRERSVLPRITEVSGVSGGSIIAVHLIRKWNRYTGARAEDFQEVAAEIQQFAERDVRNRVLRRRWGSFGWWETSELLEAEYRALFGNSTFASGRPDGAPRLSVLATSLTTGQMVAFEDDGVRFFPPVTGRRSFAGQLNTPFARAVAASAAFPILSSPVVLKRAFLGVPVAEGIDHLLTDGGVFDNLGAYWLAVASPLRHPPNAVHYTPDDVSPLELLIVSDAARPFEWSTDETRSGLFERVEFMWRNIRANDLLMYRLAEYDGKKVEGFVRSLRRFDIGHEYSTARGLAPDRQYAAARVRTDLDRFGPELFELLRAHGRNVAADILDANPI